MFDAVLCGFSAVDLVFIVDSSTSVTKPNFDLMLNFTKALVEESDINSGSTRVGYMIYSNGAYVIFHLNRYNTKESVLNAIDNTHFLWGGTNTYGALNKMRTEMFTEINGDRPGIHNVVVLITDGVSNKNKNMTIPEAQRAWIDGIHIYTIGVGLANTSELYGMASPPAEQNTFTVSNFSALHDLPKRIFGRECARKGKMHFA